MLSLLGALISRNALAVMACAGLIGWATIAVKKHDTKVARAAVAEVEKVTEHAAHKGRRAAQRSSTSSVRGPIDPTTRDD